MNLKLWNAHTPLLDLSELENLVEDLKIIKEEYHKEDNDSKSDGKKEVDVSGLKWSLKAKLQRRLQPGMETARKSVFNMQRNTPQEYKEFNEEVAVVTLQLSPPLVSY